MSVTRGHHLLIQIIYRRLRLPYNTPRAATIEELRKTNLEWTTFYIGQIMDHLGTPHIRSHMGVYSIHIDMANLPAAIPGTGNDILSFTYSFDVARFVEAALDIPRWETEMFCYSDNCTYNDVLNLAEEARGMLVCRPSV
jgi:nucleoside-diphosphate-sugar epimerase